MKMNSLRDLLVTEVRDLYNAENQLVKALPKMAKAASSPELREAIEEHLDETKGQVERLEMILEKLDLPLRGKRCKAMEGLIHEGKELLEEDAADDVLDAGIIAAAQKVEHYEIASYGCAKAYAEILGEEEIAELLEATLEEEKAADSKLSEIAMSSINLEAAEDEESEELASARR